MMQFLMDILSGAENAAIIVGLIIGVNLVKKAVEYGKENTENEKVKRWLEEIEKGFETAVKAVNQTLVDGLKYEDAFDKDAQAKARAEAKKIFLRASATKQEYTCGKRIRMQMLLLLQVLKRRLPMRRMRRTALFW